jgi:hypothetical protein
MVAHHLRMLVCTNTYTQVDRAKGMRAIAERRAAKQGGATTEGGAGEPGGTGGNDVAHGKHG